MINDIRKHIFHSISDDVYTACIFADMDGILAGTEAAEAKAREIGLTVDFAAENGSFVSAGDLVMQLQGRPEELAVAEEILIGLISKPSGIASAAKQFVRAAGNDMRIVCGSWKKMPAYFKDDARKAIVDGGACCRISEEPMVYLDKNYVQMLGGIQNALWATEKLEGRKKVIQVKGRYEDGNIVREAMTAINAGADIVYVDTGKLEDVAAVVEAVRPVLSAWETELDYRKVEIAFGGGVKIEDIAALRELGVDIVGVGRAIIDAPLLDMRMEITGKVSTAKSHHSYNLLDKSELLISNIKLYSGNLNKIASIVAEELGINKDDVLVIDVRDNSVALDILQKELDPSIFIGKEKRIIERISMMEGVVVSEETNITSRGMLGWIAADEEETEEMLWDLEMDRKKTGAMEQLISRRVIVFPTGTEVENGEIEDTNTPLLIKKLTEAGFTAEAGPVLKDDLDLFAGKLRRMMDRAYGVMITTGGVGAENKDYSVEAILRLDPDAATPYIAKFKVGEGRHRKEGIRIAVGRMGLTTLVALPGPNDEVALCADCLAEGLSKGWSKELLAGKLARLLRVRLTEKMAAKHHHH